jgi:hypothetical protein
MTGPQWSRLLASVESRRPQFNDLLLQATETVKRFFLCPASTPAVEFSTLPVQLSFPQTNGVSIPTPDLSPLTADQYRSNITTVADERIHQHSPVPPEDNDLEEPLSQSRSQSRTEARLSFTSNPQLSVDDMNAEPVGLVANTSTVSLDLGNRERAGSILALEGSTFHGDLLSPDWLRRDGTNSVLPSPDWSSGFGFSTS